MIFKPIYRYETGCAAYLVGCGGAGLGAVIDPHEGTGDKFIAFAAENGIKIDHVIDTHVHADHVSDGPALAAKVGASYCLHKTAAAITKFKALNDGDEVKLGNLILKVLHTPGHTPESISLVGYDNHRSTEPWFTFTGDTLFVGSVGRPDLPGNTRQRASELFDSLHQKIMVLPDHTEVYPGHFAGSRCGVEISGKPSSTIGFERRFNTRLSLARDEFIEQVSIVPPKPRCMAEILAANRCHIEVPARIADGIDCRLAGDSGTLQS